jgi:metal-sulfur cluster biosynthetic enzyme
VSREEESEAMEKILKKHVDEALANLVHPEIDSRLTDLGMIQDVTFKGAEVRLTLKVPFSEVPIRELLIEMIKKALVDLDSAIDVEVAVAEMDPQEREEFMKKAKQGWKL